MLISDHYRQQNKLLHEQRADYGALGGQKWGQIVVQLAQKLQSWSILDYGCGKGSLGLFLRTYAQANNIPLGLQEYDPGFPGREEPPVPADLVCCLDVLEHIEPDCIDDVLDDLARLTKRTLFAVIATRPAVKSLPDGRNCHLIQEPIMWWLPKLNRRFVIAAFNNLGEDKEFFVFCEPRQNATGVVKPNGGIAAYGSGGKL